MTASIVLQRELAKRLNGDCRLSIQSAEILSMAGDRHQSCADCQSHCTTGKHASGLAGEGLAIRTEIEVNGGALLTWACPGCGRETVERTSPLQVDATAKSIENDALCVRCRRARTATEGSKNGGNGNG